MQSRMANLGFSVKLQLINQQFKAGLKEAVHGLERMRYKMLALASAFTGGGFALAGFIGKLKEIARETNRAEVMLGNVTGKGYMYARSLDYLSSLSRRYKQDLNVLTESYAKMKASGDAAGISTSSLEKMFSSFTRTIAAFNLSTADARLAQLALQQMMSKGKISAEELRRQLGEKIPIAMAAMANAAGVPISQLDKLLKGGKLISHEVMPKFAEELEKMTKNVNLDNIETSLNQQKNKLIEFAAWLRVKDIYKGLIDASVKALDYIRTSFISLAATIAGVFAGMKMGGFAKKASIGLQQVRRDARETYKESLRAHQAATRDVARSQVKPTTVVRAEKAVVSSGAAVQAADAKILLARQEFAAKEALLEASRLAKREQMLRAADDADLARAIKANEALVQAQSRRNAALAALDKARLGVARASGGSFLQRDAAKKRLTGAEGLYRQRDSDASVALAAQQKADAALGAGRIKAAREYDAETRKLQSALYATHQKKLDALQASRLRYSQQYALAERQAIDRNASWERTQAQAVARERAAAAQSARAKEAALIARQRSTMPSFFASLRNKSVGFFGYLKSAVTVTGAHIKATGAVVLSTLRAGLVRLGAMLRSVFSATIFAAIFGLVANIISKIVEGVRETKRLRNAVGDFYKSVDAAGRALDDEGQRLQSILRLLSNRNLMESTRLSLLNQANGLLGTQYDREEDINAAIRRRLELQATEARLRASTEAATAAINENADLLASAPDDVKATIERLGGLQMATEFNKKWFDQRLLEADRYDRIVGTRAMEREVGLGEDEALALDSFMGRGRWLGPKIRDKVSANFKTIKVATELTAEEQARRTEQILESSKVIFDEMTESFQRISSDVRNGSLTAEQAEQERLAAEKKAVDAVKAINDNSTVGVDWAAKIEARHKALSEEGEAGKKAKTKKLSPTERALQQYAEEIEAVSNLRASGRFKKEELDKRENEAHGALIKSLLELEGAQATRYSQYKKAVAAYNPEDKREYNMALKEYTVALRNNHTFFESGLLDEKQYQETQANLRRAFLERTVVLEDLTATERAYLSGLLDENRAAVFESKGAKPQLAARDSTFDYKLKPSERLADYGKNTKQYYDELKRFGGTSAELKRLKSDLDAIDEALKRLEVEDDIDLYRDKLNELHAATIKNLIGSVRTLTQGFKDLSRSFDEDSSLLDRFFAIFDLLLRMTDTVNELKSAFGALGDVRKHLAGAEAAEVALPSLATSAGNASAGVGEAILSAKDAAAPDAASISAEAAAIGERTAAISAEAAATAEKTGATIASTTAVAAETAAIGVNTAATVTGGAVDATVKTAETAIAETETVAQIKLAGAKAGAAYAGIPFAGIAMAVGAIAAIMSAIKSAKGFANGGLVDYGSTFGDRTPAFVNKGERILSRGNQEWLSGLAGRLRSDVSRNNKVEVVGRFELENNKLVAAVKKENQRWER